MVSRKPLCSLFCLSNTALARKPSFFPKGDTRVLVEGSMLVEAIVHLDGYAPNSIAINRMEGYEIYKRRKPVFNRIEQELK